MVKRSYYLGFLLLIYTSFCYSDTYMIHEKYTGAPFIKNINLSELIDNCTIDYEASMTLTNEERELDRKRCPLNTTKFDFTKLYDLIDKKKTIYQDGDFELVMNSKKDETANYFDISFNKIVYEVNLSLVYKQQVKSTIILASYSYNTIAALYLSSNYYYIDNDGDIYILSLDEYGDHIDSVNTFHYKIDKENLDFIEL